MSSNDQCERCKGLLIVGEMVEDGRPTLFLCCVNCGNILDAMIIANRDMYETKA